MYLSTVHFIDNMSKTEATVWRFTHGSVFRRVGFINIPQTVSGCYKYRKMTDTSPAFMTFPCSQQNTVRLFCIRRPFPPPHTAVEATVQWRFIPYRDTSGYRRRVYNSEDPGVKLSTIPVPKKASRSRPAERKSKRKKMVLSRHQLPQ